MLCRLEVGGGDRTLSTRFTVVDRCEKRLPGAQSRFSHGDGRQRARRRHERLTLANRAVLFRLFTLRRHTQFARATFARQNSRVSLENVCSVKLCNATLRYRPLPPGVPLSFKFTRAPDHWALIRLDEEDTREYKIEITKICMLGARARDEIDSAQSTEARATRRIGHDPFQFAVEAATILFRIGTTPPRPVC